MSFRPSSFVVSLVVAICPSIAAAQQASGSVTASDLGVIKTLHATAYVVRDQHNARTTSTEVLLTDVPIDATALQGALEPHIVAINLDALKGHDYILFWVRPDGSLTMNATFSKTMTQYVNDTNGGLKATWTTNTASRVEGHVSAGKVLKTMDGVTYTVDVKFAVDVPKPPAGQALLVGGGDAGRALTALIAAAQRRNWPAIRAASSPSALKMFDRSYNTPAENAASAADLLKAWIATTKMKITGGQLRGNVAVLEVEGEQFPGMKTLSLVRMVKTGLVWQFDEAARAGFVD